MTPIADRASERFDFDQLFSIRQYRPRRAISVPRFAQRFAYTLPELERLVGVAPGGASRNPFGARLQRFMELAIDVAALLGLQQAEDFAAALSRFKGMPLPAFDGRTAEAVLAAGEGVALLDELRAPELAPPN